MGLCPGGSLSGWSLSRGSLSRTGVSVKDGGLCPGGVSLSMGLCQGDPRTTVTCGWCAFYWNAFLFFLEFWGKSVLFMSHWYPCFGLLVTSPLGFKARVDPLFVTCAQWIPQIHLWCDTCWPLDDQHGSRAVMTHLLIQTFVFVFISKTMSKTRMHSSRMRTAHLLAVFHSIGGGLSARGCLPRGVSARGSRGVRHPPVNRMTDRCNKNAFQ